MKYFGSRYLALESKSHIGIGEFERLNQYFTIQINCNSEKLVKFSIVYKNFYKLVHSFYKV